MVDLATKRVTGIGCKTLHEEGSKTGKKRYLTNSKRIVWREKMPSKPKKNRNDLKAVRAKQVLRRERLFGTGFLCLTMSADGYSLFRVSQHWRTFGDLLLRPGLTAFLLILTVTAILNVLLVFFNQQPPRK